MNTFFLPLSFRCFLLFFPLLLVLPGQLEARSSNVVPYSSLVPFITNAGQLNPEVAYYTDTTGGTVYVTRDGSIVYKMEDEGKSQLEETFSGSLETTSRGEMQADAAVNYYRGSDASTWREGVKTFHRVYLGRKYEYVDIHLAAVKNTVEKIFTVHPGGNVSDIKCRIKGARELQISDSGHLVVLSPHGKAMFTPPFAYQVKDGRRSEVRVSYAVRGSEYGFSTGDYDKALPLVIDPLLASTYMGGKSNEAAYALKTHGGDMIVAGTVDSSDFPGLDDKVDVLGDAFVVRLDPDLSTVRAATYFGGSMTEGVRAIAVGDASIFAAGYNNSPNFPTTPDAAYSGTSLSGAFVVGLDPGTLRIKSATSFFANVFGLAWSPTSGNVYVAGSTGNTGIPIPGDSFPAFQQTHRGGADSFVAVLDEDLRTLKGATLLGGEGFDIIYDLTVDDRGYPVAVGITNSAAFPATENAFATAYNLDWEANHQWIDGFVARFTPDLSDLASATYLGGGMIDNITAVAAEGSLVLVGGNTASADFPCGSTFGPVDGNDAFVVLFDEELSRIKSCTVFGGSRPGTDSPESVSDVAFHPSGSIFAVGKTNASDFPTTPGAFFSDPTGSYFGAFIISFDRDMSAVEASTLVHGSSEDLKAVAFNSWGDVVVAGDISGGDYPVTERVLQSEYAGGDDLVISRFTSDLTGPHVEAVPGMLSFDPLPVGTEKQGEIVLYNTGGSELVVNDVDLVPGSSAAFHFDNPCRYIPAFGSCSVKVYFKPFSTGTIAGELVVFSNDPFRGQVVIGLEGRGVEGSFDVASKDQVAMAMGASPPRIEARPDPCDFGEVSQSANVLKTVTVINSGGSALHLSQAALESEGTGPFVIEKDTCSGSVLAGVLSDAGLPSGCEVQIAFTPERTGNARARLLLSSSDPLNAVHRVLLTGTGVEDENSKYPGFWGWIAILVLVLRMVLGVPVSASGWGRWMKK